MLDILGNKAGDGDDLLKELEKLPTQLGELYANRLEQIKDRGFAVKIFQWLVTCKRPPTVDGLRVIDTINRTIQRKKNFDINCQNPP